VTEQVIEANRGIL